MNKKTSVKDPCILLFVRIHFTLFYSTEYNKYDKILTDNINEEGQRL